MSRVVVFTCNFTAATPTKYVAYLRYLPDLVSTAQIWTILILVASFRFLQLDGCSKTNQSSKEERKDVFQFSLHGACPLAPRLLRNRNRPRPKPGGISYWAKTSWTLRGIQDDARLELRGEKTSPLLDSKLQDWKMGCISSWATWVIPSPCSD